MSERLAEACRRAGVRDERVLRAVVAVDRTDFVPEGSRSRANVDGAIPIGRGQTTSQPSLVARMLEALDLEGDEHVLEVGTGLGYEAALLGHLARRVTTVERFEDLAAAARDNLAEAGLDNVEVVVGDGTEGWPETAPYDAVVVAAAFPDVPQPLVEQLTHGGRLVQPIGSGGAERVTLFRRGERGLRRTGTVVGARFVRLVGRHGFPEESR